MRKLLLAALLAVGVTAFAQEKEGRRGGKEKMTTEQKVDFQVKKMTKDLGLTESQIGEVKNVVTKQVQKREEKRAELKADREKAMAEMKANREKEQAEVSTQMKKILNADQYAKWEKLREEQKEKMKERMQERREKKDSK